MIYHSEKLINNLNHRAQQLRLDALEMICRKGTGHIGGSLSAADIVAALYFHHLRIDPDRPDWPERDRFILSKGHACAVLYAALARSGFFPLKELETWGHLNSRLQGHPDRLKTPGVDMTTGFLGHGPSIGAGLCLAACLEKMNYNTYVLIGDGECQSGILWEGALTAGKYKLSNLTVILDYNDVQLDGIVHEIMPLEPLKEKWKSFNFNTIEINGHNMAEILDSLDMVSEIHDRPTIIIAHTTKGKGVSFMENKAYWHYGVPDNTQYTKAKAELKGVTE